jgi:hypothetical protein
VPNGWKQALVDLKGDGGRCEKSIPHLCWSRLSECVLGLSERIVVWRRSRILDGL